MGFQTINCIDVGSVSSVQEAIQKGLDYYYGE